jgi:hypothetical protein
MTGERKEGPEKKMRTRKRLGIAPSASHTTTYPDPATKQEAYLHSAVSMGTVRFLRQTAPKLCVHSRVMRREADFVNDELENNLHQPPNQTRAGDRWL